MQVDGHRYPPSIRGRDHAWRTSFLSLRASSKACAQASPAETRSTHSSGAAEVNDRLAMLHWEYIQLRAESADPIKHRTQVTQLLSQTGSAAARARVAWAGNLSASRNSNDELEGDLGA